MVSIETYTRKLSTWNLHGCFKRWAPHLPEKGIQQSPHSQQTKQVLSARLYRLDGVRLKTEDSMKDEQQEKKQYCRISADSIFRILQRKVGTPVMVRMVRL